MATIPKITRFSNEAFKYFLPTCNNAPILIYDYTLGKTTLPIANHFQKVICLCNDIARLNDIVSFLASENIHNVQIVVGKIEALPFKSSIFGLISLHRIWLDFLIKTQNNTYALQDEIVRSLKTGGYCYISFNWQDTTSRLLSLLTRPLRKLAISEYQIISYIYYYQSFDYPYFIKKIQRTSYLPTNIASRIKYRLTSHNIGYLFRKGKKQVKSENSLLSKVSDHINKDIEGSPCVPDTIICGSGGSQVCDLGHMIVRFPQNETGRKRCQNNFSALNFLQNFSFNIQTPSAVRNSICSGQEYFVESKIQGISLDNHHLSLKEEKRIFQMAYEFLVAEKMYLGKMDAYAFNSIVDKEFKEIYPFLQPDDICLLEDKRKLMRDDFLNKDLPLVIQHGDYKLSNFIASQSSNKSLVGIFDWDLSRIPGLPVVDIIMMTIFFELQNGHHFIKRIWPMAYTENNFIINYLHTIGIDNKTYRYLLIFTIIFYLNNHFWIDIVKRQKEWYSEMIANYLLPICRDN